MLKFYVKVSAVVCGSFALSCLGSFLFGSLLLSCIVFFSPQKRRCLLEERDVSTHDLPQEFVELQRAYFKDVDDFELAEEEVSESELDHEGENKCYNHDEVEAP